CAADSLISAPLGRTLPRRSSSGGEPGASRFDHQPNALPDFILRRRDRLPRLVPAARRRRAGDLDRQVLLPDGALPAALLRAQDPRGLLADRELPRELRAPRP